MRLDFHRDFNKQYKKLSPKLQEQTRARLKLFVENPDDRLLRRHNLKGGMNNYWSINISGDYRALYEDYGDWVMFIAIGSHSELYG
jgi:addiction module RelE/StbE family toxin